MAEPDAMFLGTIPEMYDRHLGPVIFRPYAMDLTGRMRLDPGQSVLEVACGTGILTEELRARLPQATRLVATDLNEPMVDYARSRLRGKPIEWRTADAAALPFTDGSFAAVACQFGLMFVPDKQAAFREARRVLAERGLFAFNVWDSFEHNPFGRIAHETIAGFFPTDPPTFYQVPFGFHDPDVLRRLLAEAGFAQVEIDTVTLEARSPSARSFAEGLVKGNPVSTAIRERGASFEPIIEAVARALARAGGDAPFRSSMQALVASARAAKM